MKATTIDPDHSRAFLYEGEREEVVRPPLRRSGNDGARLEVELWPLVELRRIPTGYGRRSPRRSCPASAIERSRTSSRVPPGVSPSNVSRLWIEVGPKFVDEVRGKNLGAQSWCVLMLDGIPLSSDQTAVVTLERLIKKRRFSKGATFARTWSTVGRRWLRPKLKCNVHREGEKAALGSERFCRKPVWITNPDRLLLP